MKGKPNKGKKLCSIILSFAMILTTIFTGTMDAQAAASGAAIKGYTSVKAGGTASYTIKNLKKGQYVKISVTGTASAGITLKVGKTLIKSTSAIKGTGKNITLSVSNHNVVGKRFTLNVRTYDEKTKKKVGNTATTTTFVYRRTTGIKLDKDVLTLKEGEITTLRSTQTPSNSTEKIRWKSSDSKIAAVSGGKVTAAAPGTATITVTSGSVSASCEVTVERKEPSIVSFAATGAKILTAVFDREISYRPSDFTVKKGSAILANMDITVKGKVVTVTSASKMTEGTYSIAVKEELKEAEVQNEILTKLTVTGTNLAETSKSGTATAEIGYQSLNQYGERMTAPGELSITCSFGKAVVKAKASAIGDGVIYIYDIPINMAIVGTTGTIALVDSATAVNSTAKITYALPATLAAMKFLGTYNTTTSSLNDISVGDTIADYVYVFEAKNQYGSIMDAKTLLLEGGKIILTATPILSNITILGTNLSATNLTTVSIDGRDYPAIRLASSNGVVKAAAGSMKLTVINSIRGLVANETLNVLNGTAVKSVSISAGTTLYAEDKNELQYQVIGSDGREITRYDALKSLVEFTCSTGRDTLEWEKKPNGTAALMYTPAATGYSGSDNRLSVKRGVTITANPRTAGILISTTSLKVYTARTPVAITGISGGTLACAKGEKIGFSLKDLIVEDQYSSRMLPEQKNFPTGDMIYCIISNVTGDAFLARTSNILPSNMTANGNGRYETEALAIGSAMIYLGLNPKMDTTTADCAFKILAADPAQATDLTIKSINNNNVIEVEAGAKSSGITKDMVAVYGKVGSAEIRIPSTQFVISDDTYISITLADGLVTRSAILEITVDTISGGSPVSKIVKAPYTYSNKDRVLTNMVPKDPENTLNFPDTESDTMITSADLLRGFDAYDQYGNRRGFPLTGIKYNVVVVSGSTGSIIHNNTNDVIVNGSKGDTVTLLVTATCNDIVRKQSMQFTFKGRVTDAQRVEQAKAALTLEFRSAAYSNLERAKQAVLDLKLSGIKDVKMGNLVNNCSIATITFIDGTTTDYLFTNIGTI